MLGGLRLRIRLVAAEIGCVYNSGGELLKTPSRGDSVDLSGPSVSLGGTALCTRTLSRGGYFKYYGVLRT